jgi:hypothetical protein
VFRSIAGLLPCLAIFSSVQDLIKDHSRPLQGICIRLQEPTTIEYNGYCHADKVSELL